MLSTIAHEKDFDKMESLIMTDSGYPKTDYKYPKSHEEKKELRSHITNMDDFIMVVFLWFFINLYHIKKGKKNLCNYVVIFSVFFIEIFILFGLECQQFIHSLYPVHGIREVGS
jgi:hypothetical protein